jgi:hypothetical protein
VAHGKPVKPSVQRYGIEVAGLIVSHHRTKKEASKALTRSVWRWRLGNLGKPTATYAGPGVYRLTRRGTNAGYAQIVTLVTQRR